MYIILAILIAGVAFCIIKKLVGIAFFLGFLLLIYFKLMTTPEFQELIQYIGNFIK